MYTGDSFFVSAHLSQEHVLLPMAPPPLPPTTVAKKTNVEHTDAVRQHTVSFPVLTMKTSAITKLGWNWHFFIP